MPITERIRDLLNHSVAFCEPATNLIPHLTPHNLIDPRTADLAGPCYSLSYIRYSSSSHFKLFRDRHRMYMSENPFFDYRPYHCCSLVIAPNSHSRYHDFRIDHLALNGMISLSCWFTWSVYAHNYHLRICVHTHYKFYTIFWIFSDSFTSYNCFSCTNTASWL